MQMTQIRVYLRYLRSLITYSCKPEGKFPFYF